MILFRKKIGPLAQSTLEYSLITALVTAGIVLMGPYVIRSWNAHMKGYEDAVLDSHQDPLLDEPDPDVSMPGCECGDLEPKNCEGSWETVHCSPLEMLWGTFPCDPPGCEKFFPDVHVIAECRADEACCRDWHLSGPPLICGVNVPGPHGPCDDGAAQVERECAGGWEYGCSNEVSPAFSNPYPRECVFECNQSMLPPDPGTFVKCKDSGYDPDDEIGLSGDTDYTFVEFGQCNPSPALSAKCEIQCCPDWCAEN